MAKSTPSKPPRPAPPAARSALGRGPLALNRNFNQQTRKLLAKHYRAKYGVK